MQTVNWAGSSYNIPNQRGDTPWSGLSDFAIAVAAKGINTNGGAFTLLADINFGATFGLVSTYFKSRTANIATAGILRLASADTIQWRNNANGGNVSLSKNSSDELLWNGSRIILAGGGLIVNADISASAAIAFSKLATLTNTHILVGNGSNVATDVAVSGDATLANTGALTLATVNGNIGSFTYASITVNAKGLITAASNGAATGTVTSVSGTANQITSTNPTTTPVLALASPLTTPGAATITGNLSFVNTATQGIVGSPGTTDAAAGNVGEYIESVVSAVNYPATGNNGNITSISLTAGDWDVTANLEIGANGANVTEGIIAITSTTTGGGTIGSTRSNIYLPLTGVRNGGACLPNVRIKVTSTTTYYFNVEATYSVATPQGNGRISARRIR